MANKQTANKGMSTGSKVAVGATLAAAGIGAYLLFGPNGKKNQKAVKGWAVKMKGEIIEKFEQAKEVSEPIYHAVIDQISQKYAKMKNVDQAELDLIVADIKKHWKTMSKAKAPKSKSKAKPKSKPKAKAK